MESKQYIGNKLEISIKENTGAITVIGNSCNISIEKHEGKLKIIGNQCNVNVASGNGKVSFVGNSSSLHRGDTTIKLKNNEKTSTTANDKNKSANKWTKSTKMLKLCNLNGLSVEGGIIKFPNFPRIVNIN